MTKKLEQLLLIIFSSLTYFIYMYLFSNSIIEYNMDGSKLSYLLSTLSLLGFISVAFGFFILSYASGIYFGAKVSIAEYFDGIYKALYFEIIFHVFSIVILLIYYDEIKTFTDKSQLETFSQMGTIKYAYYIFNTTLFIYAIDTIKEIFKINLYKSILSVSFPLCIYFLYRFI